VRGDTADAGEVGPLLVEELVKQPGMSTEQVRKRIGALVRKNLDVVVPG